MVVIVDKLGYIIPSSVRQSLLRTFGSKTAREHGVTLERARRLVHERIRGKVQRQHERAPLTQGIGNGPESAACWTEERRVGSVIAGRWVRAWVKDGTLEVVARGRYRRAER